MNTVIYQPTSNHPQTICTVKPTDHLGYNALPQTFRLALELSYFTTSYCHTRAVV